jgi:hypothetical protein
VIAGRLQPLASLLDECDLGAFRPTGHRRGREDQRSCHPRAVEAGDLPDLRHRPTTGHEWVLVDEHDVVDCTGDQRVGDVEAEVLRLRSIRSDAVYRGRARPGMDRRQRPVVALAHRVEHGDRLVAEDLAHDDARRVLPQGAAHQCIHADPTAAIRVRQDHLRLDDVRMQVRMAAQSELERLLDGDQSLLRRNHVDQRAQQSRLAGIRCAANHHVHARQHGGRQERCQLLVDGLQLQQSRWDWIAAPYTCRPYRWWNLGQEHLREPVAADRHAGPLGRAHHRRQPRPITKSQIQLRCRGGPRPRVNPRMRGLTTDDLNQILIGGGERPMPSCCVLARVSNPDFVTAVCVDVLDLRVVQ